MKFLFRIMMAMQVWLYRLTGGKLGGRMCGLMCFCQRKAQERHQVIATAPSYADYEKRTTREIP